MKSVLPLKMPKTNFINTYVYIYLMCVYPFDKMSHLQMQGRQSLKSVSSPQERECGHVYVTSTPVKVCSVVFVSAFSVKFTKLYKGAAFSFVHHLSLH